MSRKIRELDPLTAADIGDDTIYKLVVDKIDEEVSYGASLAEIKQTAQIRTVATVAAMQALTNAKDNQLFQTLGYSTEGVGANLYRYDAASSATHDGGFVITATGMGVGRFIAVDQTVADVTKFGAVGDGAADDTSAIQAAILAARDSQPSGWGARGRVPVYLPAGVYRVTDEIDANPTGTGGRITIKGDGTARTTIQFWPSGSTEDLACISCKGGPTNLDHVWFPEFRDFSILMQTTGATAIRRYGMYFLYPTRAHLVNIEFTCPTVTGKDWVGLRIGREQNRCSRLSFDGFPVALWVDGSDNCSFTDMTYINAASTPSTLPNTAVYAPEHMHVNVFDGNQMVAGFEQAFFWRYLPSSLVPGTSVSHGVIVNNLRTEQQRTPSAFTVTASAGTDEFTATAHGLRNTDLVSITSTGSIPGGVTSGRHYFVVNATANTFQISLDPGGSAVNLSSDGTATISAKKEIYRFDFAGSQFVYWLHLSNIMIGDPNDTNFLINGLNTNSTLVSGWQMNATSGNPVAFNIRGLSPSMRGSFRATNGVLGASARVLTSNFSTVWDAVTLAPNGSGGNLLDSNDWVMPWAANTSTYNVNNTFSRYRTQNSVARDVTLNAGAVIKNGHTVTVYLDSNSTLKHTATQILTTGADFTPTDRAVVSLQWDGTAWYELGR